MRKLLYLLLFAFNFVTSQTKIIDDTISKQASIIRNIGENSIAGISFKSKDSQKTYQGYRLCEEQYLNVDKLGRKLNTEDSKTLLNSDNGALKTVGFIILAKSNNEKTSVMKMLEDFLNGDYVLMTKNCSNAIQTTNLPEFCYKLVTERNLFFKSNFKLSKKEKKTFESKLKEYQAKFLLN